MVSINCKVCNAVFNIAKYRMSTAKYCSHKCYSIGLIGTKVKEEIKKKISIKLKGVPKPERSVEHRRNLSISHIGKESSLKGKRISLEHRNKLKGERPNTKGELNHCWKGDKVGYFALHEWIRKMLAKPFACNHCEKIKPLQLANKSHEYKRDINDWLWLCRKCHHKYDDISVKLWITRKSNLSRLIQL